MSLTQRDIVTPTEVINPDGTTTDTTVVECPSCGAHPHAGPEKDKWSHLLHCWKCGYRDGNDLDRQRKEAEMYAKFVQWYQNQPELQHPTVNAPSLGE